MKMQYLVKIISGAVILGLVIAACSASKSADSSPTPEPAAPTSLPETAVPTQEAEPTTETAPTIPIAYPEPTGSYPVGVYDFEFVDTTYPMDREEDVNGRRLMVRVWYSAANTQGERRLYFAGQELEAIGKPTIKAIAMLVPDTSLLQPLGNVLTHSYEAAPIATDLNNLPVFVYSHGGLSYVSQNSALMEELASHGYLVFSLTHPGGSSGILYPNGDTVRFDNGYHAAIMGEVSYDPDGLNSPEISNRYAARTQKVDDGGLGPWLPRWRDDKIALVDFIETGTAEGLLGSILAKADVSHLAYGGMSYGAAAAASAAQADPRALAAFNLDGTHHASDLLGIDIRVPLLAMTSEPVEYVPYTNEFFFESLNSMGNRDDVIRVWIPGITHLELSDNMFFPSSYREVFPGGGLADGTRVHNTLSSFTLSFFNHYLLGEDNGYPAANFEQFPEVRLVDVSYVQDWASSQ